MNEAKKSQLLKPPMKQHKWVEQDLKDNEFKSNASLKETKTISNRKEEKHFRAVYNHGAKDRLEANHFAFFLLLSIVNAKMFHAVVS